MKNAINIFYKKLVIIFLCLIAHLSNAQKNADNIWMLGAYGGTLEWYNGLMYFDFSTDPPQAKEIDTTSLTLRWTRSNWCDTLGEIMFYTNGCVVYNKEHRLMENGDSINAGTWGFGDWCTPTGGYLVPQSTLVLQVPGQESQFLFLHGSSELFPGPDLYVNELRVTKIDMSLHNGLGGVTSKNEVLMERRFSFGKLTACRHANGIDWWIPLNEAGTDDFYFFLLDSTGIHLDHVQSNSGIVTKLDDNFGQAVFSPDGSKFARFDAFSELDIFHFDRCHGLFYAPVHIDMNIPQQDWWGCGVAFSPNSQYLYASANIAVYQFDMAAADVLSSKTLVAEYDGFIDFYATNFYQQQLGPDGRIYILSSSDCRYLHVINYPDSAGVACDVAQHSVLLPNLNSASFPNFPNLQLGAATNQYCDSISQLSVVHKIPSPDHHINIFPNPSNTSCTVAFPENIYISMIITDATGRIIQHNPVEQSAKFLNLDTSLWPSGIYYLTGQALDGKVGRTILTVCR